MDPKQALDILEQATRQLSANRDVHLTILQAIEALRKLVAPEPPKEPSKT
jgi:hypothetical protein